ncbi:hypothetical protein J4573_20040 [Actinomadura barringtoniae]|uniref:Ferric oxidoreductase domain-containing protein n=1 Tax=Actinomadura barringtoniae TaxID=1427535 RepID=A0A939PG00_9ACTN|nr:hypothetical protein [Actinomadura barringtoniae]MBO2449403.1 hypothetical protein [Actinomadura barringtoniae]
MGTGSSRLPLRRRTAARRATARRVRVPVRLLAGCVTVGGLGVLVGMSISMGWIGPAGTAVGHFLDFYGGVFTLVPLSLAVMIGLLATDRAILSPRHRIHAQSIHRALAFLAVSMLVVHVTSQVVEHRVGLAGALVPFGSGAAAVGFGTLACYSMIVAVASGIARGRFALTDRPWVWRALHLTAYAAWPLGIWHGLTAGRHPKTWVTASYALCFAAVVLALLARPFLRGRGTP